MKRRVIERKIHPGFDREKLQNNFMLLKLDKPVDSLPHVWIDSTAQIEPDAELYVVGFGFTASLLQVHQIYSRTYHHTVLDTSYLLQHGNDIAPGSHLQGQILQKAKLSQVPHAVCNAYDQYAGFIDKESMICANDDDNTCKLIQYNNLMKQKGDAEICNSNFILLPAFLCLKAWATMGAHFA